jgi:hypothetical protein
MNCFAGVKFFDSVSSIGAGKSLPDDRGAIEEMHHLRRDATIYDRSRYANFKSGPFSSHRYD